MNASKAARWSCLLTGAEGVSYANFVGNCSASATYSLADDSSPGFNKLSSIARLPSQIERRRLLIRAMQACTNEPSSRDSRRIWSACWFTRSAASARAFFAMASSRIVSRSTTLRCSSR